MRFGDVVILTRGSRGRSQGPGHEREIKARYIGARGGMVFCELLEDDPMATTHPFKAGDRGVWHGRSFIRAL
jgi:hypothetical protein